MGGYISKPRRNSNLKLKHPLNRFPSIKYSSRVSSRTPSYTPSVSKLPEIEEPHDFLTYDPIDTLQIAHYMIRAFWGKNYFAPVADVLKKEGSCVLDINDEFPGAYFTGIDTLKMYPTEIKPRNVKFICGNWLEGLDLPDDYFDYVFINFLNFGLSKDVWENKIIPEVTRVLKPGGYIEITPCDLKWYNEGPIAKYWMSTILKELKAKNVEPAFGHQIIEMIEQTGKFSQPQSEEKDHPIGSWGGDIGKTSLSCLKYYIKAKTLQNIITYDNDNTFETMFKDLFDEIEEQNMYSKSIRFWAMKI
ncbi:18271_t:CDS:2 [Dentiscutata erythropus]|uniref:18271_t:CDS:1 n=1 Tax=Dentiscutata erythropus TaxID=1348616 RepID=A0A9N8WLL4_9GLOM|nr:18271_t:CDS:2 [Dentiscutata erythropus]